MKNIKKMAKKQKNENKPENKPIIMQPITWSVIGIIK
ncbi:hypothetical protein BCF53_10720 [Reinekea marinisedimentorum]|uniref:Uncharacterized protein n=1 Tax=Reinekea marinisedimentorum TaxID=230495 RepID=A0A4R3I777_9GAMM|nr:hypothetical protein BCF53_10720 [Reinekea marinisedimentorum]